MLFYSIIFVITAVDQVSKYWIRSVMKVGESMPFYKDFISFTYYQNSGAAGSSLQGWAPYWVFLLSSLSLEFGGTGEKEAFRAA